MNPFYQDNHINIYCGDARNMVELEDESVQCVITSPPYWGLRKYSGVPDLIWGPSNCKHQWQPDTTKHDNLRFRGKNSIVGNERNRDIHPVDSWRDCEHRWVGDVKKWHGDRGEKAKLERKEVFDDTFQVEGTPSAFCSLCGAWKGSYGLEPTPEMYIEHTIQFLREIRRVLRKDGVVFWNIGDSYTPQSSHAGGTQYDKFRKTDNWSERSEALKYKKSYGKPKDLCLIPFRVAIAAQEDGWWVISDIIWSKSNPMPESVTKRPTTSHEYILMLVKNASKSLYWTHRDGGGTRVKPKADYRWIKVTPTVRGLKTKGSQELCGQEQHHGQDIDPNRLTIIEEVAVEPPDWKVKIKCPECGATGKVNVYLGLDIWQEKKCPTCNGKKETQLWKRINLWRGHDYYWDADAVREPWQPNEYDIARALDGGYRYQGKHKNGYSQASSRDDHLNAYATGQPIGDPVKGRNIRSVWEFPTQPYPEAHFAVFPEKLPETCIKAATPEVGCCSKCGAPWERVVDKRLVDTEGWGKAIKDHTGELQGSQATIRNEQGRCGTPIVETIGWQPTCKCNELKYKSKYQEDSTGLTPQGFHRTASIEKERAASREEAKRLYPGDPVAQQKYINDIHDHGGIRKASTIGWEGTCDCNADKVPSIVLDPFAGAGTTLWVAKKLNRKAIGYELSEEYCQLAVERCRQQVLI